jgi:protein gp37
MGDTKIAWTDKVWNPVTGCSKVSSGCAHCYAEALSKRFGRSFEVTLYPERLDEPLHWRKPRRVFVDSMSDTFHGAVPDAFVTRIFGTMAQCPQHSFQLLTKRPERMRTYLSAAARPAIILGASAICTGKTYKPAAIQWPLPNVWLGTSIENDRWVGRANALRDTPAAVRFISAEPLLGPLPSLDLTGIDWLIIGGESGPKARPMDPQWACDLALTAKEQNIAVFVKQASGPRPGMQSDLPDWVFALREYPA